MPKIDTTPTSLKPYICHGLDLQIESGGGNAVGDCPFCGREGKFSVKVSNGVWRCFVCNAGSDRSANSKPNGGGNVISFMRLLWEHGQTMLEQKEIKEGLKRLAIERRLLSSDTLVAWGVVPSPITGLWLVPGYDAKGKINQLYRYVKTYSGKETGKMRLYPTTAVHHSLMGVNLYDHNKSDVYLCEGAWDGMALWEIMTRSRPTQQGLVMTNNVSASVIGRTNVLATPGCNVFNDAWLPLFAKKRVSMMYHNDHPRMNKKTGKTVNPAGLDGMKRVALSFITAEQPPSEIRYIEWGSQASGNSYTTELPSGYDVRDHLTTNDASGNNGEASNESIRRQQLSTLLGRVKAVPDSWMAELTNSDADGGGVTISELECHDWKTLVAAWRVPMKWTEGLDRALAFSLAIATSTMMVGDQLWGKVVGPPSCGKSVLCEALSVCRRYIFPKSTIRGFHSGWMSDKKGKEDNSLIAKIKGKTLVTKDGDALLRSPNVAQILSEARDLYDTTSRSHYRNKMSKDYEGIRTTWILFGTESLRELDSSELGERFVDCIIMEKIDDDLEDSIGWRKINQVRELRAVEANGKVETQQSAPMMNAMRLTGGYVRYLRENASQLLSEVEMDDDAARMCLNLGKFVSFMRARPPRGRNASSSSGHGTSSSDSNATREMSARLISQIGRLALCTAVVLNKNTIDDEVIRRVARSAYDTARGTTLKVVTYLHKMEDKYDGMPVARIALAIDETEDRTRKILRFLKRINVVELIPAKATGGSGAHPRWKLSRTIATLYQTVSTRVEL